MGIRSSIKGVIKGMLGMDEASKPAPTPSSKPTKPPEPEPEPDNAISMANIECGAQELKERLDCGEHIVIVDVRTDGEVAGGVVPGAVHIELRTMPDRWEELKNADEIVCYCAAGMRSFQAATFLRERGLINATSLEGGIGAWSEAEGELGKLS
ncbi:MAG: rhodanese-like domain-containing protein [Proteobacteria bacterium]|nr:rhodanese-like domain-containing protein [Pseudomonadota bacterium]MCP4921821.1 rhodanese-like domain-containing protein [Pseudomonadota bacterium]